MKKQGFTLIELLVVISIIAVLMSIMMPALSKVREQGKTVVCGSNLKNNVNGLVMYAMDNKDCAVPKYKAANKSGILLELPWDIALRPYFSTDVSNSEQGNVVCPADRKPRGQFPAADAALFDEFTSGKSLARSYMMNGALENMYYQNTPKWWSDGTGKPAKYSQVYDPANTIWMYDHFVGANDENHANFNQGAYTQTGCIQGSNYWNAIWVSPSVVGFPKTAGTGIATISDQHITGGNWAYFDSSVKWHKHNKNAENLYHAYGGPVWSVSWADTKTKKSLAWR